MSFLSKKLVLSACALGCCLVADAQTKTTVKSFNLAGPFAVTTPFAIDTVDVQGRKFDDNSLMSAMTLTARPTSQFNGVILPSLPTSKSVGVLSFYLNNSSFFKGKLEVKGPKNAKLYVDGMESDGTLNLAPEHHTIAIRYLAAPKATDSLLVTLSTGPSTSSGTAAGLTTVPEAPQSAVPEPVEGLPLTVPEPVEGLNDAMILIYECTPLNLLTDDN